MTTAKEALLAAGRIKAITRGRMSLENHAWLKAEYDKGMRFSDWPKGEIKVTEATESKPAEVRVKRDPALNGEKVISDFTIIYARDDYKAVGPDNHVYGMAEVCNNCRVSLVQCHCPNPTILGTIPVRIMVR